MLIYSWIENNSNSCTGNRSDRIPPEFMIFQIVPDFLIKPLHYLIPYFKFKLAATKHNLDTIDKSKFIF